MINSPTHRPLIYIDWFMVRTANLVLIVSYVSGRCKNQFEKQAQIVGTKQSRQADMADRLTRQTGWQADKTGRLTRQAGWQGRQAGRLTRQAGWQGSWAFHCFGPASWLLCPLFAPLFCWSGCFTNLSVLRNLLLIDIYAPNPLSKQGDQLGPYVPDFIFFITYEWAK